MDEPDSPPRYAWNPDSSAEDWLEETHFSPCLGIQLHKAWDNWIWAVLPHVWLKATVTSWCRSWCWMLDATLKMANLANTLKIFVNACKSPSNLLLRGLKSRRNFRNPNLTTKSVEQLSKLEIMFLLWMWLFKVPISWLTTGRRRLTCLEPTQSWYSRIRGPGCEAWGSCLDASQEHVASSIRNTGHPNSAGTTS